MGARTIDEGSIDEKTGMNFSEYVAILSGNTDLLEKARLEKKVAALESEKRSFGRNKANSESKLKEINTKIDGNNQTIERLNWDWEAFKSRAKYDGDGNAINSIKLEGVESADIKALAAKLAHHNEHANTQGDHFRIGTLYGFRLTVKTETSQKDALFKENKFFAEGDSGIKYTHNYGNIATDPKLAVKYFINAIEKIPALITKYQTDNEKLTTDKTVLQEIVNSTWRRESELKDLKTELDAVDRKIQLSLRPIDQSEDKPTETEKTKHTDIKGHDEYSYRSETEKTATPDNGEVEAKATATVKQLQSLLDGGMQPSEFLKVLKETMGDRFVVGSVPNYNNYNQNQRKGIKI